MNDQADSDRAVSGKEDNSIQYPIPNSNSENPIAIAIEIVKKPNSIAIAIGYWVLVLHVYSSALYGVFFMRSNGVTEYHPYLKKYIKNLGFVCT